MKFLNDPDFKLVEHESTITCTQTYKKPLHALLLRENVKGRPKKPHNYYSECWQLHYACSCSLCVHGTLEDSSLEVGVAGRKVRESKILYRKKTSLKPEPPSIYHIVRYSTPMPVKEALVR